MVLSKDEVVYCYSEEYCKRCSKFERETKRALFVHSLSHAYGLLERLTILSPPLASRAQLCEFHSSDYIDFVLSSGDSLSEQNNDESFEHNEESLEFGFAYDCPIRSGLADYVRQVAGASIGCAEMLNGGQVKVAINWGGGWHHAQAGSASGFCYVNDCVLAILKLRERFEKVLYVDLDVHHGDGVQSAFYTTDKVMTFSIHCQEPGFFPGCGSVDEIGAGRGKYFTANVPLREGVTDREFADVFGRIFPQVLKHFRPDAIVVQCGADCLGADPTKVFNLTPEPLVAAVRQALAARLPTLLLGGGGYDRRSTAICWTRILGEAVLGEERLDEDIPEHDLFPYYGPSFDLVCDPGGLCNRNRSDDVEFMVTRVCANVAMISNCYSELKVELTNRDENSMPVEKYRERSLVAVDFRLASSCEGMAE